MSQVSTRASAFWVEGFASTLNLFKLQRKNSKRSLSNKRFDKLFTHEFYLFQERLWGFWDT
ncbi:hypothetical protein B9Q13_01045 [Candidatus Marsarchaeota G2 archaeon ECH_B_SAG-G16]|uniref:Uncharacterized protein n=1 Tax=Candidatus Marsarchaeota G2 archaeon ECH_B_SAG-G16 TaxID=1978167 RepID=A0A2R6C496_9ARCH|nr:MAG: hypothetical protein B9Q13_01045 [Candidatus Marsarchaeota G2 archaeon ECH_B_SAG-G16]